MMADESQDIRWVQRFENFDKAFILLSAAFGGKDVNDFSDLEQEGLIQRFEYTFELAWKTMKDYIVASGIDVNEPTPRNVIKEAFACGIIDDGQCFIDMMLARNLLSHTYDSKVFVEVLGRVKSDFIPALEKLHAFFIEREQSADGRCGVVESER
jgi:nucleotidyltransferase substrate binding protein (TIGR01987 family)